MKSLLIGIFISIAAASMADCSSITFETLSNATYNNLPVDFSATVNTGSGFITVTLNNYAANPKADTQLISGLQFTLNFGASNTPSISSSAGQLINIADDGTWNDTIDPISNWEVSGAAQGNTTTITMDIFTGGKPNNLVIGGPTGNLYDNANPSITGHQPLIQNTATFMLLLTGVTDTTLVTSATFNAGTQSGQGVTGVSVVPEPKSFLLILPAVLLGIHLRRKRAGTVRV